MNREKRVREISRIKEEGECYFKVWYRIIRPKKRYGIGSDQRMSVESQEL